MSTTEELLQRVRLLARLPNADISGIRDSDLLELLNGELIGVICPMLVRAKQDYLLRTIRIPLVSGVTRYSIPWRFVGHKLDAVYHVWNGTRVLLGRLGRDRLGDFTTGGTAPSGLVIEGSQVILVPETGSFSGYLELYGALRPGAYILSSSARRVSSIDSETTISLDSSAPDEWDVSQRLDIHSASSGSDLRVWNRRVLSVDNTTVEFAEPIDGSVWGDMAVAVGDWVVPADTCVCSAIPEELEEVLTLLAASVALIAINPQLAFWLREIARGELQLSPYVTESRLGTPPQSLTRPNPLYGD